MKCILHIGTEKTGTTFIQKWLYKNLEILKENKIYLPKKFGMPNNWYFPYYFSDKYDGHFMKKNDIKTQADKEAFFADFSTRFTEELEKARGCEYFLITSEHFHSRLKELRDIERLKEFLSTFFEEIYVICYFREQSAMALSLYSTDLKGGGIAKIDKFMRRARPENYYFNFSRIADNWSRVFGRERCIFRIYDRKYFANGDLRFDFFLALGFDCESFSFSDSRNKENISLSGWQAVILREVNEFFSSKCLNKKHETQRTRIKDKILHLDALRTGPVHYERQREVFENFIPYNEKFLNKYFPDGECFDFLDIGLKGDIKATDQEVADILASMTNIFLDEIIDDEESDDRLSKSHVGRSKFFGILDYSWWK